MWDESFAGRLLLTFLVGAVPVIELRGAIPFGVVHGLPLWAAACAAYLGNLAPVPFVVLFIRRVFALLRTHFSRVDGLLGRLERRADGKAGLVQRYRLLGLYLLVAIPLPGTGAWTGALVAAMLNIRLSRAFPVIAAGVATAGVLVSLLTSGVASLL